MVADLVWSFTIASVETVTYVIEDTYIERKKMENDGDKAVVKLLDSVKEVISLERGAVVTIKRGLVTASSIVFNGFISGIEEKGDGSITITCFNNLSKFKLLLFTKSFDKNIDSEAGEISAIAETIITDGGLTASVVATGVTSGDTTLNKFISDRDNRTDKLKILANIVNYIFYEDYNNDWIRFEPTGSNSWANPLIVGNNVYNVPSWQSDINSMRNKIYVEGAQEEDTRIETFNGDTTTVKFTLVDTPEILKVTVGGVLQTLGVDGGSVNFDYTVDKEQKTITFETGSIPTTGTNNINVEYTTFVPYTSIAKNDASIAQFKVTQEEKYKFKDLKSLEDSDTRASGILNTLDLGFVKTVIETDEYGLYPGLLVSVEDINNPVYNDTYIVEQVRMNYPDSIDLVSVGSKGFDLNEYLSSMNDRLKSLESGESQLNDILRQIIELSFDTKVRTNYVKVNSYDVTTSDELYWDSEDNDLWANDAGTVGNDWGSDTDDNDVSGTDIAIIQGHNKYNEFVQDTDFHDSVNSTATFNTTTKQITFTSGQLWQSKIISKGFTPTAFTLTLGSLAGSVAVTISGDGGSTWQTVSSFNTRTNFTSADTSGIIIKITEDATSTATLQPVYTSNDRYSSSAVFCYIE